MHDETKIQPAFIILTVALHYTEACHVGIGRVYRRTPSITVSNAAITI